MRHLLLACAIVGAGPAAAQDRAPDARSTNALSDAQKERFLLQAKVLSRRGEPQGGVGTERAILALDGLEHEAHVQEVEGYDLIVQPTGSETGLRDNWRHNVAAYRLDSLLGLRMVPVTVERREGLKEGSFTWWVDDFVADLRKKVHPPDAEAWARQLDAARIFDQLIANRERQAASLLVDKDWRVWMIGHSRAFKASYRIKSAKGLGERCPRGLLEGLRRLDKATVERAMQGLIDGNQIDSLLDRRDAIVRHFEERIASSGEGVVLYDLPPRP